MTTIWHNGPPPHESWWLSRLVLCGRHAYPPCWRWWDGTRWGYPVSESASPRIAGRAARRTSYWIGVTQWCDYWPENARVPRIDPRDE